MQMTPRMTAIDKGQKAMDRTVGACGPPPGLSAAQFNDSLTKLSDLCFILAGETGAAGHFQSPMPSPHGPDPAMGMVSHIKVRDARQADLWEVAFEGCERH